MENKIGASIKKTFAQLVADRQPLEKIWKDAYQYTSPLRGQYFVSQNTDGIRGAVNATTDQSRIFDSTASDAVSLLAASIMSGLTPSASQWFLFRIKGVSFEDLPYEARVWIESAARTLFEMIHNASNFNAVMLESLEELAISGQFGLFVNKEPGEKFVFELWPLDTLYLQENPKTQIIDTVYRLLTLTASDAESAFGYDQLPQSIRSVLDNNPDNTKKFEFIHCIRPRTKRMPFSRLSRDLPYASIYVERASGTVVKESGYNELPVIVPRWTKLPRTAYAVGPVNKALPDIKTLNRVVEMMLQNAEMAIAGTYVAKADGYLNPNTIKIGARKVIFAQDPRNIVPLASGGDFRISFDEITRLQRQIKSVMMADELEPYAKNYASATEVSARNQIVRQILAPIFARLNSEFLEPMLNRCFQLALRDGSIAPPPEVLAGVELVPEYQSSIARATRMEEVTAMSQYEQSLGATAQLRQNVLDIYDFDLANIKKAQLLGVPSDVVKSKDQIRMIRRQQEEAARAQAEAEMEQQRQQAALQNPQLLDIAMKVAGGPDQVRNMIEGQQ